MREKAVIGDDGSQVSRKGLLAVVRTNLERLEPMPFRTQLQDTRANAQGRIIGLIWRKGLGTSRADISGNGRRACEPEFNYKGCEQSRSEMERWTGTPEGTWNVPRMFRETHAISAIASSTKSRMREKAVIGDDGSQVSRKGLSTVVRTNLERLEPMPFRTQLQDVRKESQ